MYSLEEFELRVDTFKEKHGPKVDRILENIPHINLTSKYIELVSCYAALLGDILETLPSKVIIKKYSFSDSKLPLLFLYEGAEDYFEMDNVLLEVELMKKIASELKFKMNKEVSVVPNDFKYEDDCICSYFDLNIFSDLRQSKISIALCLPMELFD